METPTRPRLVLLTGAAGGVGTFLRALLPGYGYQLRCFDRLPVPGEPGAITADLRDPQALATAMDGVDAVVHLAGIAQEAPFPEILAANIDGSYRLYEAARAAGVRRIVFASSNHAVGFTERPADGGLLPVETPQRPDTYYGLSKCFGENLASLYADRHGIETVSLRIGSCLAVPRTVRMLATWLSPADCARLVHASLSAPVAGHTVVYGISANTRAWWDLAPARALGYRPLDNAEEFAAELLARLGELPPDDPEYRVVGGSFTRLGD
ncbi:NAD(P)-dependent oxidoreductase [Kitasatospora acidiphila]|uniref:NAD(P)-dependent oxidoreductase n=1 Tax=Kitasatospora acidiphila TaxID=2567942 RepID=A0A540WCS8_9ACTN|nr:NAD(P)-dependent oxidoreductase [Kitasatospora acidiphila]TQF06707.1 NAD(P)-dependent oxidoreductase [Kitasatospora acidiphila]